MLRREKEPDRISDTRSALDRAYALYYDALPVAALAEDAAWAEFAQNALLADQFRGPTT